MPVAVELTRGAKAPLEVARALHRQRAPGLIFFDSGRADHISNAQDANTRWSIVASHPAAVCADGEELLRWLDDPPAAMRNEEIAVSPDVDLPFYGGLAGMLGFEFGWLIQQVPTMPAPRTTPDVWVGEYPCALVFSHADETWWLVGDLSHDAAHHLREAVFAPDDGSAPHADPGEGLIPETPAASERGAYLGAGVSPEDYAQRARYVLGEINAGRVEEVNYTERFHATWPGDSFAFYEKLRTLSTGAYCAFLDAGDFQLASLSPEQFLRVEGQQISTRPIKGTRPRGDTPAEDARLAEELRNSPKDRTENLMTVDAVLQEMAQICQPASVEVSEVCGLYSFSGVHHLISTIQGELRDGVSPLGALLACFPPGSIVGAPKVAAMDIIARLEEDARGPYTGALFYASADGRRLDSSVLIRTALLQNGRVSYGAGGAVVAQSDPRAEYEEACVKARPLAKFFEDPTP